MATYTVNDAAVERAHQLIESRQYVLDSDWGDAQPTRRRREPLPPHAFVGRVRTWHLGLTEGANDGTKARYAFVFGDLRRITVGDHRLPLPGGRVAPQGR